MSASVYGWSGKLQAPLPAWWLRKVIPLLDKTVGHLTAAQIAQQANVHSERTSQLWDYSAISRFRSGKARPIALAHAISAVFGVPSPFFIARSESAAKAMAAINQSFPDEEPLKSEAAPTEQRRKRQLAKIDDATEQMLRPEKQQSDVDVSRTHGLESRVYGEISGQRASRADRTKPRRT